MSRLFGLLLVTIMLELLQQHPAHAEDEAVEIPWQTQSEIHSALPLYADFDEFAISPRMGDHLLDCRSDFRAGDWRFVDNVYGFDSLYGLHHPHLGYGPCQFLFAYKSEWGEPTRIDWSEAQGDMASIVPIGAIEKADRSFNLWILQLGLDPGPKYMFLRSAADDLHQPKRFDILQQVCPLEARYPLPMQSRIREDWEYNCLIDSRQSLEALARDMAQLPPRGWLEWQESQ